MRTDVLHFDAQHVDPSQALKEVEKVAVYCDLHKKQTMILRLLAEELLGLTRAILGACEADFYLESTGKEISLHTVAQAQVNEDKREKLLQVSSTGVNEATRGIMGKIRRIVEAGLFGDGSPDAWMLASSMHGGIGTPMSINGAWSLIDYMDGVKAQQETHQDAWDELEKSIVAKLADDVTVSVRNREAKITIKKKF